MEDVTAGTLGAEQDKQEEERNEKLKGVVDHSKVEADIAAAKQIAAKVTCNPSMTIWMPACPPHPYLPSPPRAVSDVAPSACQWSCDAFDSLHAARRRLRYSCRHADQASLLPVATCSGKQSHQGYRGSRRGT